MNARTETPVETGPSNTSIAGSQNSIADAAETPTIVIFTLPKPFDDPHIACIQRNAIASWKAIGENVEVVLIGDEAGIAETAEEFSVTYIGGVKRNKQGTPLVSDAFEIACASTNSDLLVYCNADVILLQDFNFAMTQIISGDHGKRFLAIGRRINLDLRQSVNFCDRLAVQRLLERTEAEGNLAPIVCKEYFAFPRSLFGALPPFAVGRGNWDNWMVADTKRRRIPVVDLSDQVNAIHQNHDYQHVTGSHREKRDVKLQRKQCYLSGPEARENQRLANGKHIITGSTASHRLTENGVVKNRWSALNLKFWADLPRFAQLVRQLFFG